MITTSSTLSYERQTVPPIIPAVQGDTGRNISFTISDYEIPEGASAAFYIQKPSGEAIYNTAEIVSSNVVNVPLDAQCLAEAGENFGQVRILLDDEVITSFSFILLVKVFHGVDAIESLSEMNVFDQAVADAAADFQTEAEQITAEVIESIPSDYTALSNDVTGLKQDLRIPYGVNLFNKEAVTPDAYIDSSGNIQDGSDVYDLSDYIPIDGNLTISFEKVGTVSTVWVSLYNSSKVWQSRTNYNGTSFTVTGSGYIRINLWNYDNTTGHMLYDTIMINEGTTAQEYVPYYTAYDRYSRANKLSISDAFVATKGYVPTGINISTIFGNGSWIIDSGSSYTGLPTGVSAGFLQVFTPEDISYQILYRMSDGHIYYRRTYNGSYLAWVDLFASLITKGTLADNSSLNSATQNGIYLLNSTYTYTNMPVGESAPAFLINLNADDNVALQIWVKYGGFSVYTRRCLNNSYSEWISTGRTKSGKIAMFGDSITWGQLGGEADDTQTPYGIPYWVTTLTNIEANTTFAEGGMGWLEATNHDSAYDHVQTFDLSGYDFVSFAFGLNDNQSALGSYTDTYVPGTENQTIMGAMYNTMMYMRENYPEKTLIIISPTLAANYNSSFPNWSWTAPRPGGWTLKSLTEEYEKFCDYYHIPFVNMSRSPINSFNVDKLTGGASDVHPTQEGYDILGRYIAGQLSSICG